MKNLLSDSHTDFLTILNKRESKKYISIISNITNTISCAIFTTEYSFKINDIVLYNKLLKQLSKEYNINLLLSIEDLGFIKDSNELVKLLELKPFSISLTWNNPNQYAGGANSNIGLTPLGIKTINLIESKNVLIDTAHLSKQSFNDFVKITKFPIYNSHSNIYDLFNHQRNLDYKQIKKIVETNGYLGITIYNKFISNSKISSWDIAYQFDYLIKNFGYNNFGFGTDLYGFNNSYLPTDIKQFQDLLIIKNKLLTMGHKLKNIEKIMHLNFQNFVKNIIKNV